MAEQWQQKVEIPIKETPNEADFLCSLFPNRSKSHFSVALQNYDFNEVINWELNQDNDFEFWSELSNLRSMFPNKDEGYLMETYEEFGFNDAVDKILNDESKFTKIILPKHLTQHITKQDVNLVKDLQNMFPMFDANSIESTLTLANGNSYEATLLLSKYVELYRPDSAQKPQSNSKELQQLLDLFPNINARELKKSLDEFGLERAINYYLNNENVWHSFKSGQNDIAANNIELGFKVKTWEEPIEIGFGVSHTLHGDPLQLRSQANEILQKRNYNYIEAARQFKLGKTTGRGAAVYYSQLGHDLNRKMKDINSRAADLIFSINQKKHADSNIIDLHGLTEAEASLKLDDYLNIWFQHRERANQLKIITGWGNHSVGKGKLFPAMMNLVKKKGWKTIPGGNGWFYAAP